MTTVAGSDSERGPRLQIFELPSVASAFTLFDIDKYLTSPSMVDNSETLAVQVHQRRFLWSKELAKGEFAFKTLLKFCSGGMYEISNIKGITIRATLEAVRHPNAGGDKENGVGNVTPRAGTTDHPASGISGIPVPSVPAAGFSSEDHSTSKPSVLTRVDTGNKSSRVVSGLSTALEAVQEVAKIPELVHLVEPIGAILSELTEVYKEIGDPYDKTDAILEKVATVARDICRLILQLKNNGLIDRIGHLESDLGQYTR
ncbi:hypothetical protein B0H14DRAFT_2591009 [Mycena olivaceomarginata]|nr:hypothetical protein B0H14DRAFT_2591009 [Mycena olivaceomarginata]